MSGTDKKSSGFTIVELLIVIVVIAILASISIVAYNGIQGRANDSRRLQDLSSMQKVLSIYNIEKGFFPPSVASPNESSYESSTTTGPTPFLASLNEYTGGKIFADPINSGPSRYLYKTFGAGTFGCPASLGSYYVIRLYGMQAQSTGQIKTNGCDGQTLATPAQAAEARSYYYWGFN